MLEEAKKIGIAQDTADEFTENQEDRVYKIRDKSFKLAQKVETFTLHELEMAWSRVNYEKKKLEKEWPALFGHEPSKIYAHIDLDSFYASVETLDRPELKNIPLGVGSSLMLATSNYKAREYGVRAGMPGYIARRLCPELVILPCNFSKYNLYSEKVMNILSFYDQEIEIYGIDEACLVFDVNKLNRAYKLYNDSAVMGRLLDEPVLSFNDFNFESVAVLVEKIREVVFRNTRLTVSAGISVCRGLAKYSCGINKPNGMYIINKEYLSSIENLPVDKINGIGKATKELLEKSFSIVTIKDLRDKMNILSLLFPMKTYINIFRLSHGLSVFDKKSIAYNAPDKSVGMSVSFKPTQDYKLANDVLWHLTESVSFKLNKRSKSGTIIIVEVKYSNFKTFSKRKKCLFLLQDHIGIFEECIKLFSEIFPSESSLETFSINYPIRLIRVSVSGLISKKETNLIEKYSPSGVIYKVRECPVCSTRFVHETNFMFEGHVNFCLDIAEQKKNEKKNTLDYYFRL